MTKTAYLKEDVEIDETADGGEEVEIEELDVATVDELVVSGVASGSPIKSEE